MTWLIPTLPLLGFVVLALLGSRFAERTTSLVGVGTVALSAVVATLLVVLGQGTQELWTWFRVGDLIVRPGLTLDPLSSCFVLVITWVGAAIHLAATDSMRGDPGYARFFAYMNLFVAAMLVLVLADDLLLLYLGWEGVGLCSYLLIGFWYDDPANGRAARKAFVVTRIGDAVLAVGLFVVVMHVGTLHLPTVLSASWDPRVALPVALAFLGGAVGKSAQIPLQTWLPDAMVGPTPVSALIHAATMVTAGVYLIARTHPLFLYAPMAMHTVAAVGLASLLIGGVSALFQQDIKRVLAYSTMSQVGYMFLALGVGAWDAAVFHFVTHALFKALLFLAAGVFILGADHQQDLAQLRGIGRKFPLTFLVFVIGALGLAGVPLVSGGFFSKEAILSGVAHESGGMWAAAVLGVGLTSLYTFRMVFLLGRGEWASEVHWRPNLATGWALALLAMASVLSAELGLAGVRPLETFLAPILPSTVETGGLALALAASAVSLGGIALAWEGVVRRPITPPPALARFARDGLGFDAVYDRLVVAPLVGLGIANHRDIFDRLYEGTAEVAVFLHQELLSTQNGQLRSTLVVTAVGAVVLVGLALAELTP